MADNDAEIDIGINLDESSFISNYKKFLTELSGQTRLALTEALDNVKGAAAKNWGTLPYQSFHDSESGARVAAKAFVPGFASELSSLGINKGTQAYEAALMSAAYKSSVPDAQHRYNLLQSYGQSAPAPSSAIERVLSADYSLMAMPWSRAFIKETANKGYDATELSKKYVRELEPMAESMGIHVKSTWNKSDLVNAIVTESNKSTMDVDFAGMRDYAVEQGIGRWLDPDKEHTADNFELISDELEKIDENSDKTEKTFTGWNDTLKSVLGTLTAIGSLTGVAKTFEIAYKASEGGTIRAATSVPRTRAFVGMGALDVLATQVAGQSVGLGKDNIYNEIVDLSNRREEYKLLGQGLDALFPSLSGIFDNIMSGDNPYDTYKGILSELYNALQGADDDTRAQALMLLEKQGLGSASYIIGSFLSNPALAAEMGNDPTRLFSLKENPYRSSYGRAETILPDIVQLNESIAASYNQMYEDWEEAFGLPFKKWWDRTLVNTVVPWFESILKYVSPEEKKKRKEDRDFEWNTMIKVNPITLRYMNEHTRFYTYAANEAINKDNRESWSSLSVDTSYFTPGAKTKLGKLTSYNEKKGIAGSEARSFLEALETAANPKAYQTDNLSEQDKASANLFQSRAALALDFLNTTGFSKSLKDLDTNAVDTAIVRVVQEYLVEGNKAILEDFLYGSYTQTEEWQQLLSLLTEYKEYLKDRPDKVKDIKVQLFNQYGGQLQADVQDVINK